MFPAHAGMNRRLGARRRPDSRVPRACRDEPQSVVRIPAQIGQAFRFHVGHRFRSEVGHPVRRLALSGTWAGDRSPFSSGREGEADASAGASIRRYS